MDLTVTLVYEKAFPWHFFLFVCLIQVILYTYNTRQALL